MYNCKVHRLQPFGCCQIFSRKNHDPQPCLKFNNSWVGFAKINWRARSRNKLHRAVVNMMRKFSAIMNSLASRHSLGSSFSDYLELSICALSNQAKEERYLEIISRYSKEEASVFAEAFAAMVFEMGDMNNGWHDPLGAYFEEFITRGHNGQFFTPVPITELMARINLPEKTHGLRILDPACGSGRTLLSAAQQSGQFNKFYGADVDHNCAMMSAINMCLHGLGGEVAWMNSLSNQYFGGWVIPRFPFPHLVEICENQSEIVLKLPETLKAECEKKPLMPIDISDQKFGSQLMLFE